LHFEACIEVVRGPSSSVYGNGALTGVINLITKSGAIHTGIKGSIAVGSYGLKKFNMQYGRALENGELYAWAQVFQTDGEQIQLSAEDNWSLLEGERGSFYIDRYRENPAHDMGVRVKYKGWTIQLSDGAAKYAKPFSSFGDFEGQTYNESDYREIDGVQPGGSKLFHSHFSVKYDTTLADFDWSTNLYFDKGGVSGVGVSDPHLKGENGFRLINFEIDDRDWGITTFGGKPYELNDQKGTIIIGAEYEKVTAKRGRIKGFDGVTQTNLFFSDTEDNPMLLPGDEKQYALFVQNKHYLTENIILNIGGRYDRKYRRNGSDTISEFSPRVSAIYQPTRLWSLQLLYASSFVDAPYFYRYNSLSNFQGAVDLRPEQLSSSQFLVTYSDIETGITSSTNIFYNDLDNFIVFRPELSDPSGQRVFNSGKMTTWGIENETTLTADTWSLSLNLTYSHLISYTNIFVIGNKIRDVPELWANIIFNYHFNDRLEANYHMSYVGTQQSPIGDSAYKNGVSVSDSDNELTSRYISNINVQYKGIIGGKADLGFQVSNVFDKLNFQGGTVQHPYQQAGRW
jgi:outer membrane receptor for ferrienterochelin and colicins